VILDGIGTLCHIYIMINHRTQIYLEPGQYEMLRARARRQGRSLASLIREALDEYLGIKASRSGADPLHRAVGIGKGDGAAVAENYEDFLYGEKS
jgi:hypothetical protein